MDNGDFIIGDLKVPRLVSPLERSGNVSILGEAPGALFPECIAKSSRFTVSGLGAEMCSLDPAFGVRNRLQPSARDHRETKVAVPMGKVTKTCLSLRVRRCAHIVLRGRWNFVTFDVFQRKCVCAAVVS